MRFVISACLICNLFLSVAAAQESQRPPATPPSHHRLRCTEKNSTPDCLPVPLVISSSPPTYSEEARKAKLEGDCFVSIAVDDKGNLTDLHVTKSLGMGLDEKAIEAIKGWKFEPAYKDGKPVAAKLVVQVSFRL
jgi:TonB family protein